MAFNSGTYHANKWARQVKSRIDADRWEAEAVWHVWAHDDALNEDEPHDRPDIDDLRL